MKTYQVVQLTPNTAVIYEDGKMVKVVNEQIHTGEIEVGLKTEMYFAK